MHVVVFSDTHGNCLALDAMLADLRGESFDAMVCLGDAIQGGPQPAELVARLRELACPVVMGNADAWLLTGVATDNEPTDEAREVRLNAIRDWSLAQLSQADRDFIAQFRPTVTVPLDAGAELLGFHGSPHSFDDIIVPETPADEVERLLGGYGAAILAGGHTHIQQIRHLDRSFYFGCGSAGFAYRHHQAPEHFRADPWAEYAMLSVEGARVRLEFRRAPYDATALCAIYRRSGRPFADEAIAQYGG